MPQPLRIAILVNPFTLGRKWGAHAPELARELLGAGHTVRGFGAPPGALPRSGGSPEVEGGALADDVVGVTGYEPDAVIAYDSLSPAAWVGARAARKLHVPLVLVEAAAGEQRGRQWLFQALGRRLWGRTVRNATSAVVALDAVARERVLAHGFPASKIEVLPAGVDLAAYRPGLSSGIVTRHHIRGRVLLYVGRIAAERGLEVLVRAFAASVGQRADWSLVLAGEGPARAELRALIERLGIASRVHWTGLPRAEELPGLLSASTLLAIPALDDSVRGLNVTRAMACGLPILVSDRPNLQVLVEHDRHGLVVPAGDHAAWREALQRAAMSPDARRRWSLHVRAAAEERYAWPRVARRFEGLVLAAREALARGARSSNPLSDPSRA
ncbi:MAG: glycosyltransferase family 4 protein [Planctomycetes bacterium]|nr:glycosyltransferase family 4 protein [Planctomycetota bacterium]